MENATQTIPSAVKKGQRLKRARVRAGMSQGELAAKCGVHQSAISKWELGQFEPSRRNSEMLAAMLGFRWWR